MTTSGASLIPNLFKAAMLTWRRPFTFPVTGGFPAAFPDLADHLDGEGEDSDHRHPAMRNPHIPAPIL
jgi:hypothetical protein